MARHCYKARFPSFSEADIIVAISLHCSTNMMASAAKNEAIETVPADKYNGHSHFDSKAAKKKLFQDSAEGVEVEYVETEGHSEAKRASRFQTAKKHLRRRWRWYLVGTILFLAFILPML